MVIDQFKIDLKSLSADQMFQRYILTGSCSAVDDHSSYELRNSISQNFTVDYNSVIIVGSANLGFSIKPRKRYVSFGDDSDVDVAIVCGKLFERVWKEVYLYEKSGAFWPQKGAFRKYLSRGWIRPDMLPASKVFSFSNEWWEYFRTLYETHGPYKITGGIYHSMFFLQQYQCICIEQCQAEI